MPHYLFDCQLDRGQILFAAVFDSFLAEAVTVRIGRGGATKLTVDLTVACGFLHLAQI
ncbi:MAG: hypothetical protein H6677_22830 [Candidatus Obscuribacterales bacterium]|nr:hypothetical protein [Candidatus Obscuribacterales bacterium]